jgi:hypothetical protein
LEDGREMKVEIPGPDGKTEASYEFRRDGSIIHVQRQGLTNPWNVLLVGIDSIEKVENAEAVNGSTLIKNSRGMNVLKMRLR